MSGQWESTRKPAGEIPILLPAIRYLTKERLGVLSMPEIRVHSLLAMLMVDTMVTRPRSWLCICHLMSPIAILVFKLSQLNSRIKPTSLLIVIVMIHGTKTTLLPHIYNNAVLATILSIRRMRVQKI